jgi:hypothetical protein
MAGADLFRHPLPLLSVSLSFVYSMSFLLLVPAYPILCRLSPPSHSSSTSTKLYASKAKGRGEAKDGKCAKKATREGGVKCAREIK